jgi:hypothetical protein
MHAGDAVEEGGFTGSVRTDNAHNPFAFNPHVHTIEGPEPTEVFCQVFGL